MYRYRLIDHRTGDDLGPFASPRTAFAPGDVIATIGRELFVVVNMLEVANDGFRGYLVVRPDAG